MTKTLIHRGCQIKPYKGGYVWDEVLYGAESDDVFATIEDAKADIEKWFGPAPAPRESGHEIYA